MDEDTFVASNQDQGEPTLLGASEGDSPYTFKGLTDLLEKGVSTANTIRSSLNKAAAAPNQVQAQSPVAQPRSLDTFLGSSKSLWIIGGAVLLLGGFFLLRRR